MVWTMEQVLAQQQAMALLQLRNESNVLTSGGFPPAAAFDAGFQGASASFQGGIGLASNQHKAAQYRGADLEEAKIIVAANQSGEVCWYDATQCYGFIKCGHLCSADIYEHKQAANDSGLLVLASTSPSV